MRVQLQIFSKAPRPGMVKSRLQPRLSAEQAARLQQKMSAWMVSQAVASALGEVVLYAAPDCSDPTFVQLKQQFEIELKPQSDGDIGARMLSALKQGLSRFDAVLLMGGDCPQLDSAALKAVVQQLEQHEVVLVPAEDGGYVLVAMRRLVAEIFSGVDWSTPQVMRQTRVILQENRVSWHALPPLCDIDRPEDLDALPAGWLEQLCSEQAA